MAGNKKVRRKRLAALSSNGGNGGPPTPRDAILRPLVDSLAPLLRVALFTPDCEGYFGTPAEVINELCVLLHARIVGKSFRHVKPNLSEDCSDATREALGVKTIRRFAQLTDIEESKLTKYESGVVLVPARYVKKLKDLYSVTHDWIFDGDKSKLPHDLVLKLLEQEKD